MTNYDILKEYEAHKTPVPSYDDWVYLHKARNDAHEIVESLTQENKQLHKWCEEFDALEVSKENKKLKDLLKECRDDVCKYQYISFGTLVKIDEVLK